MEPVSDLGLIDIQAQTLYAIDDSGRLIHVNDPERSTAPRFAMWRTTQGNVWRYRHDLPRDVVRALEAVASTERVSSDFREQPPSLALYRGLLDGHAPVEDVYAGPAFRFPAEPLAAGDAEMIHDDNAELLRAYFPDMLPVLDECRPYLAIIRDNAAVSLCHSARRSARAAEAGIETHRDYRMQGYATAAVAGWSEAVRDEGLIPLYSTSWENGPSLSVARRLGLIPYGENVHLT
jgi:hypothetical protein